MYVCTVQASKNSRNQRGCPILRPTYIFQRVPIYRLCCVPAVRLPSNRLNINNPTSESDAKPPQHGCAIPTSFHFTSHKQHRIVSPTWQASIAISNEDNDVPANENSRWLVSLHVSIDSTHTLRTLSVQTY